MHIATYIGLLEVGSKTLAASYRQVAQGHPEEADVVQACGLFACQCDEHERALSTLRERYGRVPDHEPERLHAEGLSETRSGGLGLLRDLHDLHMLADYLDIAWTLVGQAGQGARDAEVIEVVGRCEGDTRQQLRWLETRLKVAAPQALLVAE